MQNENTGRVNNYQAKLKENILARINKKNKISQSALLENVDSTNQQFKATPKVVFNKKLKNKMFKTQIVVNEKVVPTFVNDK